MNQFGNSIAEYCIHSVFGIVPHRIKSTISWPFDIIIFLQIFKKLGLVFSPLHENEWKQKPSLVVEKGSGRNCTQSHVFKSQEYLTYPYSWHLNTKTYHQVASRILSKNHRLTVPFKFPSTMTAVLNNSCHWSLCYNLDLRFFVFAIETK